VPVRVRLARPGQLKGTFAIEARLETKRWFGKGTGEAVFRQAGEFVVDVRKP
jgi:hypothetical protein